MAPTLYDLHDLHLDSDLVVLSACQTGVSRIMEGDELMGLSRGFLGAGARSLLASLWPVGDVATARFMDRFYGWISDGDDPRTALRLAMLDLKSEGLQPHEWSAFTLTGRPRFTERAPNRGERASAAVTAS